MARRHRDPLNGLVGASHFWRCGDSKDTGILRFLAYGSASGLRLC